MSVTLTPFQQSDREQFILDNQEAVGVGRKSPPIVA